MIHKFIFNRRYNHVQSGEALKNAESLTLKGMKIKVEKKELNNIKKANNRIDYFCI